MHTSWCAAVVCLSLIQMVVPAAKVWGQAVAAPVEALRLTLPPQAFAVAGQPFSIYYENLILTETPDKYRFQITLERDGQPVDLGKHESRRWFLQPEAAHVGRYTLRVTLSDDAKQQLGTAQTMLVVSPADTGNGRSLSLLIVGDSLTHASMYPNSLSRLLSQAGNPTWAMLGTHRPASVKAGVTHEGYGGWTWEAFVSRYAANEPADAPRRSGSPFVFADMQGKPQLDPARYFDEHFGGKRPDVITFLLGINDCFGAPPDDPKTMDARIDAVFAQAETLLAAMRKAAPQAMLAVCVTPPPNVREEAFVANYKGRYSRWGWRRIQHRLVERQIKHFGGREQERIYLVPTELNVDPVDGYPANNGVHPNEAGYGQIADSIYAWLKWRLNQPQ